MLRTLIFAATDTTSNSLAQIFQLLAQHPDAQEKLREEIIQASNGQDIPHDQLVELPYLDSICRETLRVFVPFDQLLIILAFNDLFCFCRCPAVSEVYREQVTLFPPVSKLLRLSEI